MAVKEYCRKLVLEQNMVQDTSLERELILKKPRIDELTREIKYAYTKVNSVSNISFDRHNNTLAMKKPQCKISSI